MSIFNYSIHNFFESGCRLIIFNVLKFVVDLLSFNGSRFKKPDCNFLIGLCWFIESQFHFFWLHFNYQYDANARADSTWYCSCYADFYWHRFRGSDQCFNMKSFQWFVDKYFTRITYYVAFLNWKLLDVNHPYLANFAIRFLDLKLVWIY